jgi:hypothetical protein
VNARESLSSAIRRKQALWPDVDPPATTDVSLLPQRTCRGALDRAQPTLCWHAAGAGEQVLFGHILLVLCRRRLDGACPARGFRSAVDVGGISAVQGRTSRELSMIVAVVAALTAARPASAQSADEQSIWATIAESFRGHATADSTVMRRPFLPTAHIDGMRQGAFT